MIQRFYILKILSNIAISLFSGFIYLYLSNHGVSNATVGILIFLFWLFSLLFEIPSAVLSDIFGRKKIYIISMLLRSLALLGLIFPEKHLFLILSFVFTGVADAFSSGCLEAWIFDVIEKKDVEKVCITSGRINTFFSALFGVIGVRLFSISSGELVLISSSCVLFLNSILSLFFINEPVQRNIVKFTVTAKLKEIIENTKIFFWFEKENKKNTLITFCAVIAISISVVPGMYYQLIFNNYLDSKKMLIFTAFLIPLFSLLGQNIYAKVNLQEKINRLDYLAFFSSIFVVISAQISSSWLSLVSFLIHVLMTVIAEIFIGSFLNQLITKNRNTILSVVFFIQGLIASLLLFIASILNTSFSVSCMEVLITIPLILLYFGLRFFTNQIFGDVKILV